MPARVFLSHNSEDKPFVRRLAAALEGRGIRSWVDQAEMLPGDSLIGKIEAAIDDVDYVLVVLSPNSVQSEWVKREVRMAMQREIAGKKVVVIPVLYQDCRIPGFLRDKVFVDFRQEENFVPGVTEILRRLRSDEGEELKEVLAPLEKMPFTQLWKGVLRTGLCSERFCSILRETLQGVSKSPGDWNPQIAASYLWFLQELRREGRFDAELISLLVRIVEDPSVNMYLRYETLGRVLTSEATEQVLVRVGLPDLFVQNEEGETIADLLFRNHLEPSGEDKRAGRDAAHSETLSRTWAVFGGSARKELVGCLQRYLRRLTSLEGTPLASMVADLSKALPESAAPILTRIKQEVEKLMCSSNPSEADFRADLSRLITPNAVAGRERQIIGVFRRASQQEEEGKFHLYLEAMNALSAETVSLMRKLHGDKITFSLLAEIASDPSVGADFALFALGLLAREFGGSSLALDDRLLSSIFERKLAGKFKVSSLEAICETTSTEQDFFGCNLLLELWSILSVEQREKFCGVVSRYAVESGRIRNIEQFLKGEISGESLKKLLSE